MTESPNPVRPSSPSRFHDPSRQPWVWVGFLLLCAGAVPVWPVAGLWWGLPAWAVVSVGAVFLLAAFTAWVTLRVWKDPDEPSSGGDDARR